MSVIKEVITLLLLFVHRKFCLRKQSEKQGVVSLMKPVRQHRSAAERLHSSKSWSLERDSLRCGGLTRSVCLVDPVHQITNCLDHWRTSFSTQRNVALYVKAP